MDELIEELEKLAGGKELAAKFRAAYSSQKQAQADAEAESKSAL